MWPVLGVVAAAALTAGVIVTLLARRWPAVPVAAPRVAPSTVEEEVRRHPGLAGFLRARIDPAAATGLAMTVAGAAVLAGGVAVGVLLVMVRRNFGFARWDLSAARWGAEHATDASTTVLRDISLLGGTVGIIVVVVAVGIIEYLRIPSRSAALFLILVVVGQNLLANGTKVLVNRARPDIQRLTGYSGSSFPSGHSTAAAATFAALALLLSRRRSPTARAVIAGQAWPWRWPWPPPGCCSGSTGSPTSWPGWRWAGPGSRCAPSPSVAG